MRNSVNFSALYFYLVLVLIDILLIIFLDDHDSYDDVYDGYQLFIKLLLFPVFFFVIATLCMRRSYVLAWVVSIVATFLIPVLVTFLIHLSVRNTGVIETPGVIETHEVIYKNIGMEPPSITHRGMGSLKMYRDMKSPSITYRGIELSNRYRDMYR